MLIQKSFVSKCYAISIITTGCCYFLLQIYVQCIHVKVLNKEVLTDLDAVLQDITAPTCPPCTILLLKVNTSEAKQDLCSQHSISGHALSFGNCVLLQMPPPQTTCQRCKAAKGSCTLGNFLQMQQYQCIHICMSVNTFRQHRISIRRSHSSSIWHQTSVFWLHLQNRTTVQNSYSPWWSKAGNSPAVDF